MSEGESEVAAKPDSMLTTIASDDDVADAQALDIAASTTSSDKDTGGEVKGDMDPTVSASPSQQEATTETESTSVIASSDDDGKDSTSTTTTDLAASTTTSDAAAAPVTPSKPEEEATDDTNKSSDANDSTTAVEETPKIDNTAAATAATASPTTTRRSLPKRNPSDLIRTAIPLPSIQECLFGIPRDHQKPKNKSATNETKKDNDDDDNDNDNDKQVNDKDDDDDVKKSDDNDNTQEDDESNKKNNEEEKDDDDDESQYMVPINLLRRVSSQGIHDDTELGEAGSSHRALAWRVLLGYLPADRRKWKHITFSQRQSYHTFVQELFCVPQHEMDGKELRGHHAKRKRRSSSKPLSPQEKEKIKTRKERTKGITSKK